MPRTYARADSHGQSPVPPGLCQSLALPPKPPVLPTSAIHREVVMDAYLPLYLQRCSRAYLLAGLPIKQVSKCSRCMLVNVFSTHLLAMDPMMDVEAYVLEYLHRGIYLGKYPSTEVCELNTSRAKRHLGSVGCLRGSHICDSTISTPNNAVLSASRSLTNSLPPSISQFGNAIGHRFSQCCLRA